MAPEDTLQQQLRTKGLLRRRNGARACVIAAITYERASRAPYLHRKGSSRSGVVQNHALGANCAELAALSRFLSSSRLSKTFYQLHCSCEWQKQVGERHKETAQAAVQMARQREENENGSARVGNSLEEARRPGERERDRVGRQVLARRQLPVRRPDLPALQPPHARGLQEPGRPRRLHPRGREAPPRWPLGHHARRQPASLATGAPRPA